MPIIESTYKPLFWTKSGFVSTVFSGLARKVKHFHQIRERITLPDSDFLDIDWSYSETKNNKVIILEFIKSIGINMLPTTRAFSNVILDMISELFLFK